MQNLDLLLWRGWSYALLHCDVVSGSADAFSCLRAVLQCISMGDRTHTRSNNRHIVMLRHSARDCLHRPASYLQTTGRDRPKSWRCQARNLRLLITWNSQYFVSWSPDSWIMALWEREYLFSLVKANCLTAVWKRLGLLLVAPPILIYFYAERAVYCDVKCRAYIAK